MIIKAVRFGQLFFVVTPGVKLPISAACKD